MKTRKEIKFYPEAWFKVEYEIQECSVDFKAWKIEGLDEDEPENSTIEEGDPNIKGNIKWDGCMNFTQDDHYCGLYHVEQTALLMTEVYKFKGSLGGFFEEE